MVNDDRDKTRNSWDTGEGLSRRLFLQRVGYVALGTAAFLWSRSTLGVVSAQPVLSPRLERPIVPLIPNLEIVKNVAPSSVDQDLLQSLLEAKQTRELAEYLNKATGGRVLLLNDLLRRRNFADGFELENAQAVDYLDDRGQSIGTLVSIPVAGAGQIIGSFSYLMPSDRRGVLDDPPLNIGIVDVKNDEFLFAATHGGTFSDVRRVRLDGVEQELNKLRRDMQVAPVLVRSNNEITDILTKHSLDVLPAQFERIGHPLDDQRITWPAEFHSFVAIQGMRDPGMVAATACCCCCCCCSNGS